MASEAPENKPSDEAAKAVTATPSGKTSSARWEPISVKVNANEYEQRSRVHREVAAASYEEVMALRKEDAFAFYSVVGVRGASMATEDIDSLFVDDALRSGGRARRRRRRRSVPELKKQKPAAVTRRTCISFEAYPDFLLDDTLD